MKGFVKVLIASAVLLAFGIAFLIIGLAASDWTINPEFTEATYLQESENLDTLSVDFYAGEFDIQFYDGDKIEIDYYTSDVHTVKIEEKGATLFFKISNNRWIGIGNFKQPNTVIKLPQDGVYNLVIDMSAGTLDIAEGNYGNIDIDMSAGLVRLNNNIVCGTLKVDMSAGKVDAGSVTCPSAAIDLSAGDVKIEKLNCPVINIDVSAGNVYADILGSKAEYSIKVDKSAGSCNVVNQTGTDSQKKIDIDVSAGSVYLKFDN